MPLMSNVSEGMPFVLEAMCLLDALLSRIGLRGPSVLRWPAFRLRFSQEVLFQRLRGLSVLRRPACAQLPLQQVLIHARARHEPQEVKGLRPVAFNCFPVAARGCIMGALAQSELPRISAVATVLKTISAVGTRP
jgi:hypothetical protein